MDNLSEPYCVLPLPLSITPLKLCVWSTFLTRFPHDNSQWLFQGLTDGFKIGLEGDHPLSAARNCPSALKQPDIIDSYLREELAYGSIIGLFDKQPFPDFVMNRFGVIPKSEPGKWRLITDLSFPFKNSVNSKIPYEHATVSYCRITDAIPKILELGRGTFMAKFDIKRAYLIFVPYYTHFPFIPLTVIKALSIARLLDTEELYLTTKTLGLILTTY